MRTWHLGWCHPNVCPHPPTLGVEACIQTALAQACSSVACSPYLRKCAHMRKPLLLHRVAHLWLALLICASARTCVHFALLWTGPPACGTGRAPDEAGHQSEITSLGTAPWLQQKHNTSLSLGDDLGRVQHDLPNAGWCPAAWGRCCYWSWGWM